MADQAFSPADDIEDFLGAKPQPAWRRRVLWAVLGLGAILLVVLAAHFLKKSEGPSFATQDVTRGALTTSVSATGKLAPVNQVTVGSQLSGLVTQVLVDVNDRVTKGQALAQIDPEQIDDQIRAGRAQLAASNASVVQARATLAQANATLARYQEVSRLSAGRVPAKTEMDSAIADRDRAAGALKVAEANVTAAEASLAQNQTQRNRAIIRSPVTGVVLARQVDPGQTVAASFNTPTLFVIAEDLSKMKLEVSVDEADVGQIKQGQRATFTVDAFPGKTFPAEITRVDLGSNLTVQDASSTTSSTASSTGQVVSYAADLSVSNPTLELRPGMTATADIITSEQKDALLVPNAALRFTPPVAATPAASESGGITSALVPNRRRRTVGNGAGESPTNAGKATVYVKGDDGTPRPVRITIGKSNGSLTVVTGGDLKPGMAVIVGQLSGEEGVSGGGARRGNRGAAGGR
ncbi:efflux RND transporter periplasmic adaptor subunit [Hephaestia sp. GCM10023244]|uniref:efflux RND transporter periplasmic adaptor subunit n=1 Tax=unclassified Hephaestia TaxID=2631281 RepID=UPI0020776980|nr:efflux RND transporter periplasmic adaptor subunit [Hephaestia sp. MAHUQ-44]MCM8731911.1 efflux RND transporter periplasmic adaptor subunit [Hephaestia sp. MAHUQ-44]